jgi:hypothetical protein
MLRNRFGPEYDRAVESSGDQRAAEADLLARERQRAQFDIKPLPEATRLSFANEWRDLQERFVDEPAQATAEADILITRVMEARGYPMKDFDAQVELISVDHPVTVDNYRFAHAVQLRAQTQQASTEDLREALLRYRSLFDEMLRPEGNGAVSNGAVSNAAVSNGTAGTGAAGATTGAAGATTDEAGAMGSDTVDPGSDTVDPATPDPEYDNERIGRRDV